MQGFTVSAPRGSRRTWAAEVYVGDRTVHALVERSAWLHSHAWVVTATTLAGTGAYQFSKLKYRCLDQCRSPLMFVAQRWRGGPSGRGHSA